MTRICIVVTARASWAKLEPICRALKVRSDVELQIVACASALLERYGNVAAVIEAQYPIAERVWSVYEGATLGTSVRETGALCTALASTFERLRPDIIVVMADRHEVLAVAQAAKYSHFRLAHCQGGERSGSVDDCVRDAVTMLSDYHFPCTEQAAYRVYALTGAWARIWNFGCPSIDIAKAAQLESPVTAEELGGAGAPIDLSKPFIVVLQHPVTNEYEQAGSQMADTLWAITGIAQTVVFWPGEDAGAEAMSKVIRSWRWGPLHTVRNLPPNRFLKFLTQAAGLVGNSSAGIRECAYLGVPVINVGTRQFGRERGPNVIDVLDGGRDNCDPIFQAVKRQLAHGTYPSSTLYGFGEAGPRIAETLIDVANHCAHPGSERQQGHSRKEPAPVGRRDAD